MINFIGFNEEKDLEQITEKTAGVIVETIQGAAGFIMPENDFFIKLKRRCEDVGALLILDEIQPDSEEPENSLHLNILELFRYLSNG